MSKSDLFMYDFYQSFYQSAAGNPVFARYCEEVFGADFAQDGFSDLDEMNALIEKTGICEESTVLDLGCGSGAMCEYIHRKTGATVWGLDYSEAAIAKARERGVRFPALYFDVGVFGQKEYPPVTFDVILSVDTLYFVEDTEAFLRQIHGWLKPGGVFAAMYGADDSHDPGIGKDETGVGHALNAIGWAYRADDYTESHYAHLRRKRMVAMRMADEFRRAGLDRFCERIITESIDPEMSFEDFARHSSRQMYIVRKER